MVMNTVVEKFGVVGVKKGLVSLFWDFYKLPNAENFANLSKIMLIFQDMKLNKSERKGE